ncbi:hypothetical protein [Alkaliphilus hydrothermalis]|uniref:AAA domain-containing protein n=1 Tax=Alkaliphilus hydrothermalis TaxID=1482730 RepID=A0ABS2NT34_9FIRM|nr:hypothetical protein [Alkaliphilus hydrothermalis]MBM7615744.1 hypothetical protein [Alkaliphilus hydrothermalis]
MKLSKERHLFGSAFTFFGHINHRDTYIAHLEINYSIVGSSINSKSKLLKQIADQYVYMGYDVDFYHEPLVPERLEAIVIPELNMSITGYQVKGSKKVLDLDQYLRENVMDGYTEELAISKDYYEKLMDQVYGNLKKTKINHDKMETFYTPNIRFKEIDKVTADLLNRILKF